MKSDSKNILLVHGGPGMDDSYFYPYLADLKRKHNVISYTQGERLLQKSRITIGDLLEEYNSILTEIPGEVTVIGHSFGACIAVNYWCELEHKIEKLVLCNWPYDNKWINEFYTKYPETIEFSCFDYRTQNLKLLSYYFMDQIKGKEVLEKITYDQNIFESIGDYLSNLNLDDFIKRARHKIVSISSRDDFPLLSFHNNLI